MIWNRFICNNGDDGTFFFSPDKNKFYPHLSHMDKKERRKHSESMQRLSWQTPFHLLLSHKHRGENNWDQTKKKHSYNFLLCKM